MRRETPETVYHLLSDVFSMTTRTHGIKSLPRAFLEYCREREPDMLDALKAMVQLESPSDDKAALDRLGEHLAREFSDAGGQVTLLSQQKAGNHLKAEFPGRSADKPRSGQNLGEKPSDGEKPLLLLGHFDTVWPLGSLEDMPFRVDPRNGRAYGPGVYDMKAGIVMMLFAMRTLKNFGREHRPVIVLLDSDEEVGSATGRPVVESHAKQCEAVLVMEPAQGAAGHLKTARKGVGDFMVRVQGKASHAGVDFEKGHSAVIELSRQILEMTKLVDGKRGITVNPGVIHGGTRSNVVAAEAWAHVDVRIARAADAAEIENKFRSLKAFDPQCRVEISGGINRPPMERTEGTARLFATAAELGESLDMKLGEASTGGGSDGNFTSALGIPTLDGLGAVGEGAHAAHESIVVDELPRRTALLAALIQSL
jgi:glutamate carboxypeptidase